MKTYWLEGREHRTPLNKKIECRTNENVNNQVIIEEDIRKTSGYSPVTFKEIARRSIANSPIKTVCFYRGKFQFCIICNNTS